MSSYIPVNTAGGTLSIDTDDIISEVKVYSDQKYVNELGDSMKGDLGMNNFLIKNSGDPIDDKDVVNKSYVNSFVNIFNDNVIKKSIDKTNKIISQLSIDVKEDFKKVNDNIKSLIDTLSNSISAEIRLEIGGSKFEIDEEIKKLKDKFKQYIDNTAKSLNNVSHSPTSSLDRL